MYDGSKFGGDRVDLRAGGGAERTLRPHYHLAGRSPRRRRSPPEVTVACGEYGSISAQAEEPSRPAVTSVFEGVDLRAGGGAQVKSPRAVFVVGRSPRRRRSPDIGSNALLKSGSISAQAEEPTTASSTASASRVDLRAGGGAGSTAQLVGIDAGRSPRRRRSLGQKQRSNGLKRSISAQAEEPRASAASSAATRVDLRAGGGAHRRRVSVVAS